MNRVDVLNSARAITELTEDDASDALIYSYARDGYERIINLERRWPFLQVSIAFDTVAGTQSYATATVSNTLREIVSFRNSTDGRRLFVVGHDEAEDGYSPTETGRPTEWSVWADKIWFWPKPDDAYSFTVRGYRVPTEWWDSDSVEIDCDDRLHMAIVYFVVARLYQLQEDAEMASTYASEFYGAARAAHDDIMRPSAVRPLRLFGRTPYVPSLRKRMFG